MPPTHLALLANVPTPAVNAGFLPAARALGLRVTLLTDCAEAHRALVASGEIAPDEIVACDVFNPLAVIDALTCRRDRPDAVFSNSDHLQTSTALVAAYFGRPAKPWPVTYAAKNKAQMRERLQGLGVETLWHATVCDTSALAALSEVPRPAIVKPREGVASQHVGLARDRDELEAQCCRIWAEQPGRPVLIEEYVEGPLHTLETLGDGHDLTLLGGFDVSLSPPPDFIERSARWHASGTQPGAMQVLAALRRFGVGLGACHTEYVMSAHGPRLIEINYRAIGDQREFLLRDALGIPLFETVLRLHLGEPLPALQPKRPAAQVRYLVADRAGRLTRMPPAFERDGLHFRPLRAVGDAVVLSRSNKDYLGVLRGHGPDDATLDAAMARELAALEAQIAWSA